MSPCVRLRVDRDLPESLALSPLLKSNLVIDLFDADRFDSVLSELESLGAVILSAITIDCGLNHVTCWDNPADEWVAGVVGSDNFEWIANESYRWPCDIKDQRVPPREPLRVYKALRGMFSEVGFHFAGRASFRKYVDDFPESFEYSTGDIVCKGKTLESWTRIEPVSEVSIISADSLGCIGTESVPYRSTLLWMGARTDCDFGFVWDTLLHGKYEQEHCALVPVSTARKLSRKFPGDFLVQPVFDRQSAIAVRALEVYRTIRAKLPMKGWA